MKLSIIIVNYNVKYFLEQCLCSVAAAIKNIEAEVFVVDNNSTDNSIAYLQQSFKWVTFIANKQNTGFAKANNQAVELAKGAYILFLNPDTIIPEYALTDCINFFEVNSKAGAVGVRMIDGEGLFLPESKRSFPSPSVAFYKLAGLSALLPASKIFSRYALGYLDEHEVHEADVLSGAFMMVKKEVLNAAGSFDELFFMYGEDIDLSYRIQEKGYTNYYLGSITIVHFKGESTKKASLNYVKMFYKAMLLFVKKHYHGAGAFVMYQALQAAILLRAFASIIFLPFTSGIKAVEQIKVNAPRKILLIGEEKEAEKAKEIIQEKFKGSSICVQPCKSQMNMANTDAGEIVFCLGTFTYSEAITLLQKIPSSKTVKWFGTNTKSIAGSRHKNALG